MNKAYSPINWVNNETPVNEANLNKMSNALDEVDNRVIDISKTLSEQEGNIGQVVEAAAAAREAKQIAVEAAEQAKAYMENAEAITGVGIATKDKAGIIRGGDNYIAEDGTLQLVSAATDLTMPNSYPGRLLLHSFSGVSHQDVTPGPDNPKAIKSAVISEIKTIGKNLGNMENIGTASTQKVTVFNKPYIGDITISVKPKEGTSQFNYRLFWEDGTLGDYAIINAGNEVNNVWYNKSISLSKGITGIGLYRVHSAERVDRTIEKIMVRKGAFDAMTDEEWVPYGESAIILSEPIELNGIGGECDRLTPKELEENIYSLDCAADDFTLIKHPYTTEDYLVAYVSNKISSKNSMGLSTHFELLTLNTQLGQATGFWIAASAAEGNSAIHISVPVTMASDVDTLKQWLVDNGVIFKYVRFTPVIADLPPADRIALNSLVTYADVTYLEFGSEVEPTFAGEYGSSKIGGYTLEGLLMGRNNEIRISELTAAALILNQE